jgi:hypothetical protein
LVEGVEVRVGFDIVLGSVVLEVGVVVVVLEDSLDVAVLEVGLLFLEDVPNVEVARIVFGVRGTVVLSGSVEHKILLLEVLVEARGLLTGSWGRVLGRLLRQLLRSRAAKFEFLLSRSLII